MLRGFALAMDPAVGQKPLTSGPATGKEVPSFFVRAITGQQMNRSVCFVCRNGDRPVVMLLLRRLEAGTSAVLKAVDEFVDRRRADGLRAFGVMLSDEPSKVSPHLQTISFDHQLSLPLGVGPEALGERDSLSIDPAASITLVAYREKKVVWTSAFRSTELRDEPTRTRRLREILEQAESSLTAMK
ncbi:MAG: hypothetical protein FJ302_00385 [Planctomycetes bacterium]|nr:hypothetical protein [Planctomycetota bacterium]